MEWKISEGEREREKKIEKRKRKKGREGERNGKYQQKVKHSKQSLFAFGAFLVLSLSHTLPKDLIFKSTYPVTPILLAEKCSISKSRNCQVSHTHTGEGERERDIDTHPLFFHD